LIFIDFVSKAQTARGFLAGTRVQPIGESMVDWIDAGEWQQ
jgi:hypothetical protein